MLIPGEIDEICKLRQQIETDLRARAPDVLDRFPPEAYLAFFDGLPAIAPYHLVPAQAWAFCTGIEAQGGPEALEAYHRLAMLHLIARPAPSAIRLTDGMRDLRQRYLTRIVADMRSPRKRFYRHGNDLFAKDFAVCRGKLQPGGVELVDICAGVGRRVLLGGGFGQFLRGAWFFLGLAGGFAPFLALHFDRRLIGEFDADGYAALYLRVADLLSANPHILGVMSDSWWHDPCLAEISPELGHIGREPESAGARLFRGAENRAATADATRFAPRRAALHRSGAYRPRVHLLAWARRDMLAWAERYRAGHSG